MKVNKNTLVLKAHYFMFFAGMAPILPFFIVLGAGLGVPIAVMGFVSSVVLIAPVFAKPLLSLIADSFPQCRKIIFVGALLACGLAFSSVCFVPSIGNKPVFPKSWLIHRLKINELDFFFNYSNFKEFEGTEGGLNSLVSNFSTAGYEHFTNNFVLDDEIKANETNWSDVMLLLPMKDSCVLERGFDCHLSLESKTDGDLVQLQLLQEDDLQMKETGIAAYMLRTEAITDPPLGEVGVRCLLGEWVSQCDHSQVWRRRGFWGFFLLLLLGLISFSTANSFSDAVTVEMIGPSGNYGSHRAWGSVGWGVMGPISGLLVDWWSGSSEIKDYTPAFVLVFIVMGLDTLMAAYLKVPRLEVSEKVWARVWPLVRQPRFFLFLFFSVLNGCFDGAVLNFLFVLQEHMAAGTAAMKHIKFIQGLTLFVQCATEVPCMYLSNRLVKKIGADSVTTVVMGLHTVRLTLILFVGMYGNVWHTVVVELLNGPCYGFGYSAIVVYAGQLAPPGASTTVQSLANISYESIGYALSSLLSGLLAARIGPVRLFFVWANIGVVTCVCHMGYVRWIPPIDADLTNPSLAKHQDEEAGGTVEEELCLRANEGDTEGQENNLNVNHHQDNMKSKYKLAIKITNPLSDDEEETQIPKNRSRVPAHLATKYSVNDDDNNTPKDPLVNGIVTSDGETDEFPLEGNRLELHPYDNDEHKTKKTKIEKVSRLNGRPVSYCYVSNV